MLRAQVDRLPCVVEHACPLALIPTGQQARLVSIGEITNAAAEQFDGIGQVGSAVPLLDEATQQNSALAEQRAAAAPSLRTQSERRAQAVGTFKPAAC